MTTYLFGLWLLASAGATRLRGRLQTMVRTGLVVFAPVLLLLSLSLQGWFPALMILCALALMEPGPWRWLVARLRPRSRGAAA